MQVGILGPLAVCDDAGTSLEVAGARLRTLLVRLALDAGRPVSAGTLVDAVWGDEPPADSANALQTLVSRLRRALGDARSVGQSAAGYRLAVDPADVDAHRFEALARSGARALREQDPAEAAALLQEALGLWRGRALADAGPPAESAAGRLEQLRVDARVDLAMAQLHLGEPERAIAELETLSAEHRLDERIAAALVTALAAAGRQADALLAYERVRGVLVEELGVDPSGELQAAHLAVLRGSTQHDPVDVPRRTNLRAQLTSFVGRDEELARVAKALTENRLVTIVGPGGAGKTRLASEAGAKLASPDGVWLAELAAVTDGADVAQAVLGALGLREKHLLERNAARATDGQTRLVEVLADKAAVVVLDNCEHVIDGSARLAENLLGMCPQLRVLATSREPLGIIGEVVLAVPPLSQPPYGAGVELAMEYPAVRLFADRAAAARPDFQIDAASVASVVDIVRRLDGLPLAIELAAARLRTMPIGDIAARLSDRFRLLTGGSRTALPRHRTLRAVVEWSWDLLTQRERLLTERLAVFPAGMTAETVAAVCADDAVPADEVTDLLVSLLEKSLLQRVGDGERIRMLETIREYGAERLAERGELEHVRRRHADYFGALVEAAQPYLTSADQLPWFDRLSAERENVLAALRFRCESGDADGALQIAVDFGAYAMMIGSHDLGPWLSDALAVPGATDSDLRWTAVALAAMNAATGAADSGSFDAGIEQLGIVARHLADISTAGRPLVAVLRPAVAFFAGDAELTDRLLEEGMRSDDAWTRAAAHMFRANIKENSGDVAAMRADIDIALDGFRALGERWGLANTLGDLAMLHAFAGRLAEAEAAFEEALDLMAQIKSSEDEVFLLVRLADVALRRGDGDRARALVRTAADLADEYGAPMESAFTIAMLGEIERQTGNLEVATAMSEIALKRFEALPPSHPAMAHSRTVALAFAARLRLDVSDEATGWRLLQDAYQASTETHDAPIMATVGVVVAWYALLSGSPERAAEILGAAATLRGADDPTSTEIAHLTDRLRQRLGDEQFRRCYESGKSLDRDAAVQRLAPAEARAVRS